MKFTFILFIALLISACNNGNNIELLTSEIRSEIDAQLQDRATEAGITLPVNSFILTHESGNDYIGVLETTEGGVDVQYIVDVVYDGNSYIWQIRD
jgi:hypothetical protein